MGLFAAADIWFHHVAFEGNEELSEWLGMKVKREKQEFCNGLKSWKWYNIQKIISFVADKDPWHDLVCIMIDQLC